MPHDSIRWAAPEVIESGIYSQASDVFSFGIVCYEVFNAFNLGTQYNEDIGLPYSHLSWSRILDFLQHGETLAQPNHCTEWCYRLMKKCWCYERIRRPHTSEITEVFRSTDGDEWNCPLLKRFKGERDGIYTKTVRPLPPLPTTPQPDSKRLASRFRIEEALENELQDAEFYEKGSIKHQRAENIDPEKPYGSSPLRVKHSRESQYDSRDTLSRSSVASSVISTNIGHTKQNPLYANQHTLVVTELRERNMNCRSPGFQSDESRKVPGVPALYPHGARPKTGKAPASNMARRRFYQDDLEPRYTKPPERDASENQRFSVSFDDPDYVLSIKEIPFDTQVIPDLSEGSTNRSYNQGNPVYAKIQKKEKKVSKQHMSVNNNQQHYRNRMSPATDDASSEVSAESTAGDNVLLFF
ncbi:receptor tyrosine-protein kinase erbB-3-like [Glandiceps talaboti]